MELLKNLWKVARHYKKDLQAIIRAVDALETRQMMFDKRLQERTTVHADIHFRHATQVIVVGQYNGVDYVNGFWIEHKSLPELVEILKSLEKDANVGRMDMIGRYPFSAVYPKDRL